MSYELRAKLLDGLNIFVLLCLVAASVWPHGSVGLSAQYFIHLASLSALLIWLIRNSLPSSRINYYAPDLPLSLFFFISFLSILFSIYRYASALGFLNLLSYCLIFFLARETVNSEKKEALLVWGISLTGLFYCLYGILQYYGFLPRDFWYQSRSLSSRFVNSGPFGAFINLNLFLSLGAALSYKRLILKILSLLFFSLFLIALILSKSRISWIVFVIVMALFLVLSLKKPKIMSARGYIFIIIIGIIIGYIVLRYRALVWERIYVAVPTQFQSLRQRFDVWVSTMRIILNRPLGAGIATFQYIYPSYRIHSDRFLVDYAHSDFLQIASEVGLAGLAAFIWFLWRLLQQAFKALFSLPQHNFFITLGLICAVISFLAQSLVDFPLHIPANAILFFAISAILTRKASFDAQGAMPIGRLKKGIIIAAIVVGVGLFTHMYIGRNYYLRAKAALARLDFNNAAADLNKSIKFMPFYADAHATRGGIYALKSILAKGSQKVELQKAALSDFQHASRLNPYEAKYYLGLALRYIDEDNGQQALSAFNKAIEKDPTNGEYYYPYADYCLEHGLLNEALKIYRRSLGLFINDDGRFPKLYGSLEGLFAKVYSYTQDYQQLKQIVPLDKLEIWLAFASFLETKNRFSEAVREYEKILAKYPAQEAAAQALESLRKKGPGPFLR